MCYCLRGRSSSCLSWGCFLPSTHFPAVGRLGSISRTLCFVSSPRFLLLPHTEQVEDANRRDCYSWFGPTYLSVNVSHPVCHPCTRLFPCRGPAWCQRERSRSVANTQCSEPFIVHSHGKMHDCWNLERRVATWSCTYSGAVEHYLTTVSSQILKCLKCFYKPVKMLYPTFYPHEL